MGFLPLAPPTAAVQQRSEPECSQRSYVTLHYPRSTSDHHVITDLLISCEDGASDPNKPAFTVWPAGGDATGSKSGFLFKTLMVVLDDQLVVASASGDPPIQSSGQTLRNKEETQTLSARTARRGT